MNQSGADFVPVGAEATAPWAARARGRVIPDRQRMSQPTHRGPGRREAQSVRGTERPEGHPLAGHRSPLTDEINSDDKSGPGGRPYDSPAKTSQGTGGDLNGLSGPKLALALDRATEPEQGVKSPQV